MLPEQQQRIMGYFIEEAKDHLNTIEQGLLNLQGTLEDSEMLNEVFRAAHSVKGGAAMLGIGSIQKTSHRLEDYFKVLKEEQHPVKVDQKLESLFLRVYDTLNELLEQLQGPFGLTEDVASGIMSGVEPVFEELHAHLEHLVHQVGGTPIFFDEPVPIVTAAEPTPQPTTPPQAEPLQAFQNYVPVRLRELLQLFKQVESVESRQQLQEQCHALIQLGEQFHLSTWCDLVEAARQAIAHPDNSYRTLAPIIIKEIKQAQDLVLANRATEILCSDKLRELLPLTAAENISESALEDLLSISEFAAPSDELFSGIEAEDIRIDIDSVESQIAADSTFEIFGLSDSLSSDSLSTDSLDLSYEIGEDLAAAVPTEQPGPEVGMAELNSLADLFEGEVLDLGATWQEEEVLGDSSAGSTVGSLDGFDTSNDFSDLLFDEEISEESVSTSTQEDDLVSLFGDEPLLTDVLDPNKLTDLPGTTLEVGADIDDLLGEDLFKDPSLKAKLARESEQVALDNLGDLFAGLDEDNVAEAGAASDDLDLLSQTEENLGDLFGEPIENEVTAAQTLGLEFESEVNLDFDAAPSDTALFSDDLGLDFGFQAENLVSEPAIEALTINDDPLNDLFATVETQGIDSDFDAWVGNDFAVETDAPVQSASTILEDPWSEVNLTQEPMAVGVNPVIDLVEASSDLTSSLEIDSFDLATDLSSELLPTEANDFDLFGGDEGLDLLLERSESIPHSAEPTLEVEVADNLDDLLANEAISDPNSLDNLFGFASDDADLELMNSIGSAANPLSDYSADNSLELSESLFKAEERLDSDFDLEAAATSESTADLFGLTEDITSSAGIDEVDIPELALDLDSESVPALEDNLFALEFTDTIAADSDSFADLEASENIPSSGGFETSFDETDELLSSLEPDLAESTPSNADLFNSEYLAEVGGTASVNTVEPVEFFEVAEAPVDELDITSAMNLVVDSSNDDFADLDALLGTDTPEISVASDPLLASSQEAPTAFTGTDNLDDFADLEALLSEAPVVPVSEKLSASSSPVKSSVATTDDLDDFADLEALLSETPVIDPSPQTTASPQTTSSTKPVTAKPSDNEFDDLEKLLEDADKTMGGSPTVKSRGPAPQPRRKLSSIVDQTMRVPVKHLDNLSNLVGELVVNRNSLEQDQERLRQFLDNLLYQVQQLSDVGQRMRDLYERSLLESSLLASRQTYQTTGSSQTSHSTGASFDALEMDRFTGFHSLSQEMIELIVRVRESASDIEFIVDETDQVTRNFRQVTTQLQEGLTRSRMVPFAQTADKLPRGVRDNAIEYGKQAELVIEGRETLIDKMILEKLSDPLTHLVNNAVAHGIERPEVRQAAGKPAVGRITVRAFYQGNQTVISVSDDGAGIDPERIKAKAIKTGIITPAEARTMSRLDVYDLLFLPGFSGADQVTKIAGRGVGMDVVRTNLNEIRGTISIDSAVGKGTTFTIRLPLTLSISKALCCISNRARIAFPMDGVEDMLDVPKERIQTNAEGQSCILWRDLLLPFQPLSEVLKYSRYLGRGSVYGGNQEDDIVSIVVLRSTGNFIALQVDQVLGEQEIVIKQLEGPVPKPIGVAGATVLGDGRIMPIADVLELIDLVQGRIRREASTTLWDQGADLTPAEPPVTKTEPTVLIVDDSITVRELLSMTFNKVGYRVEQARDGQEAWEKLRSGLPCDMVFCDIEMPRMDGLELLSRIQKDPSLNHLPIAMLTSRGADRHRQMAIQLGARGYFTKPYLEEALLDAAQRMLKGEILVTSAAG